MGTAGFRELETCFRACSLRWQRRSKAWGFRAQGCWVRLSPSLPGCLLGRTRSLLPPLQEKPLSRGHSGKRKLSGSKTCSERAPEGQREVCQPGLLKTDAVTAKREAGAVPPLSGSLLLFLSSPPPHPPNSQAGQVPGNRAALCCQNSEALEGIHDEISVLPQPPKCLSPWQWLNPLMC